MPSVCVEITAFGYGLGFDHLRGGEHGADGAADEDFTLDNLGGRAFLLRGSLRVPLLGFGEREQPVHQVLGHAIRANEEHACQATGAAGKASKDHRVGFRAGGFASLFQLAFEDVSLVCVDSTWFPLVSFPVMTTKVLTAALCLVALLATFGFTYGPARVPQWEY